MNDAQRTLTADPATQSAAEMLKRVLKDAPCDSPAVASCIRCNALYLAKTAVAAAALADSENPTIQALTEEVERLRGKVSDIDLRLRTWGAGHDPYEMRQELLYLVAEARGEHTENPL